MSFVDYYATLLPEWKADKAAENALFSKSG
jgi:hypothetical protein